MTERRTKTRQHDWREIKVTPVHVEVMDDAPVPVSVGEEADVVVGCFVCDMSVDEGWDVDCPGENLFEP